MNEFEIIAKYFKPLTQGHDDLKDDAAVLEIPKGHELVVTSDTLNEGVHFFEGETPGDIARKALRVNLSDLAAMGAKPFSYQLNIAFPQKPDEAWLAAFTKALMQDQKTYGIFCSGGDTTYIKGECLSLSITALGLVPKGKALRRSGAKAGDFMVLSGPIGDAYLGLKALRENLDFPKAIERYRLPQPKVLEIKGITEYINAAADISDGFLADSGHICAASELGSITILENFVYSAEMQVALKEELIKPLEPLCKGDDYELVLAVPPKHVKKVIEHLESQNCSPMVVGEFTGNKDEHALIEKEKRVFTDQDTGWTHF